MGTSKTRMLLESEKWKPLLLLFGALGVAALGINFVILRTTTSHSVLPLLNKRHDFDTNRQNYQNSVIETKSGNEFLTYSEKYLNAVSSLKKPGSRTIAIVASSEKGKFSSAVYNALANKLQKDSVQILSSLFKPEFISDKLFAQVFDGSTEPLNKLELKRFVDVIVLAQENVEYSVDPSLADVTTANLHLMIQTVPLNGNGQSQTWSFVVNGAGFKETEARNSAQERIVKQIANCTNMFLN